MFEELVKINNDQVVTTSLIVAEKFEREHKDVLDSIRQILVAENSAVKFFFESTYESRGKQYPVYLMNRDGFMLLVMGFSGKRALKFKLKFIEAFNQMESTLLKKKQKITPAFLHEMANQLAKAEEEAKKNKEARMLQEIATNNNRWYSLKVAAKALNINGMGRNNLFKFLRHEGILDSENCPYQEQINQKRFSTQFNERYDYWFTKISPNGMRYVLQKLDEAGYEYRVSLEEWQRNCELLLEQSIEEEE